MTVGCYVIYLPWARPSGALAAVEEIKRPNYGRNNVVHNISPQFGYDGSHCEQTLRRSVEMYQTKMFFLKAKKILASAEEPKTYCKKKKKQQTTLFCSPQTEKTQKCACENKISKKDNIKNDDKCDKSCPKEDKKYKKQKIKKLKNKIKIQKEKEHALIDKQNKNMKALRKKQNEHIRALKKKQKKKVKAMKQRQNNNVVLPMSACDSPEKSKSKRIWLYIYRLCPKFYPHCLAVNHIWQHILNAILLISAVVVWSPCVACLYCCKAICCLML